MKFNVEMMMQKLPVLILGMAQTENPVFWRTAEVIDRKPKT